MSLLILFLAFATAICGPIWLIQHAARSIRAEREAQALLSPAERAERSAEAMRDAGRSLGKQIFWLWTGFWGAILALALWALGGIS